MLYSYECRINYRQIIPSLYVAFIYISISINGCSLSVVLIRNIKLEFLAIFLITQSKHIIINFNYNFIKYNKS